MGLEDHQFGEGDKQAFPKEQPYTDQKGNGRPLSPEEIEAQQEAINRHKAKKLGRGANGPNWK